MLTLNSSEEKSTCFKFIGADTTPKTTHLISNNTSLIISTSEAHACEDTCSFYSGPSDATIMAFGESCEATGTVAYAGGETSGSIAYVGGGETSGSIASSSVSVGGGFSGGFSGGSCSYSC